MSRQEDEFVRMLRATFSVEAAEHVQAMTSGLLELERTPAAERRAERLETIFRHAHSLKGAARATNFAEIEKICQSLEDVFAAWKRREISLPPEGFDTLHRALDLMGRFVLTADGKRSHEEEQKISLVVRQLGLLTSGAPEGRVRRGRTAPPSVADVEPIETADRARPTGPVATTARVEASVRETPPAVPERPA